MSRDAFPRLEREYNEREERLEEIRARLSGTPTFAERVADIDKCIAEDIRIAYLARGDTIRDLLACVRETQSALEPFAKFACELKAGETHDCFNCRARAVLTKWEIKP